MRWLLLGNNVMVVWCKWESILVLSFESKLFSKLKKRKQ